MRALVVPSNRPGSLCDFITAWHGKGGWDRLIAIEDGPRRTFDLPAGALHFSWEEIDAILGRHAWVISRRDSAVRCFGLLAAHWLGAEYVLTLDDDCLPHSGHEALFAGHVCALENTPRWNTTVPGLHVRGLPYENQGRRQDVAISMGLWSGVPDLDGRTQLASGIPPDFVPPPGNRLLAHGEYAPISGMNLCFSRRALPLAFFPLMGDGYPYRRFDDIWMGVIAKRLCDHLGWRVSVGGPFVRHVRASDPAVNAAKEAPGLEMNERLWAVIDSAPLSSRNIFGALLEMAGCLSLQADFYLSRLGDALRVWTWLFGRQGKRCFADLPDVAAFAVPDGAA